MKITAQDVNNMKTESGAMIALQCLLIDDKCYQHSIKNNDINNMRMVLKAYGLNNSVSTAKKVISYASE